jgi:hypothetical protein
MNLNLKSNNVDELSMGAGKGSLGMETQDFNSIKQTNFSFPSF